MEPEHSSATKPPPNKNRPSFFVGLQYLLPQHLISRGIGFLINCRLSWLLPIVLKQYIRHYQVDMSLAQREDITQYQSFNDFFTRKLKPTLRPIDTNNNSIISPVDGSISQIGNIQAGRIFQAKGLTYSSEELLANAEEAKAFEHGIFTTLYLSPKDYHRIHMPITGQLTKMCYVPGQLFSVNPTTAAQVPRLFARNERVICFFDCGEQGKMAVVMVGAMIVASIYTVFSGLMAPNPSRQIQHIDYSKQPILFNKGDELGYFQLGSTVILLLSKQQHTWLNELGSEDNIIFGQKIGTLNTNKKEQQRHD